MKRKSIKFLRCISGMLIGTAFAAALAGCGSSVSTGKNGNEGKNEISCWMPLTSNMALYTSNYGETELAKELEKRTGVKVNYIHPPQGQESEKFSILVASSDLPDIIEYNWITYPGGPAKAIKEGVIVDIGKYRDKAVNLFKYLDENNDIYKMVTTDNNEVFSFPFIRGDKSLGYSTGLLLRGDWLKELNLEIPRTIDEWEKVLYAFKDKKGAKAPFSSLNVDWFASGFDTTTDYYVEDGKI
ncbi:MAG: extracellular solute-binding protein, partial [Oscillospiraceae bacterium]|nr:extracellular solute-binding protein [Oscillospiraceae bacterium]